MAIVPRRRPRDQRFPWPGIWSGAFMLLGAWLFSLLAQQPDPYPAPVYPQSPQARPVQDTEPETPPAPYTLADLA